MHIDPWLAFDVTMAGMWMSAGADYLYGFMRLRRLRKRRR